MTLIHIYFYGCRWYCVLRDWKRMLDAFCAHGEGKKLPPTPTDPPYILQLSFHSWLFVFTFLFFDLRRRCVAYLPSFIYIHASNPPAEKNRFYLLTYFQPVAGGTYTQKEEKKQTASHSIILRHHPKPIPSSPTRLTLLLCKFVRPLPRSIKSSLFQAKPFDSM